LKSLARTIVTHSVEWPKKYNYQKVKIMRQKVEIKTEMTL